MSKDQLLLIQLLMGKTLDAILTQVAGMAPAEVDAAIIAESGKTEKLLEEMRNLSSLIEVSFSINEARITICRIEKSMSVVLHFMALVNFSLNFLTIKRTKSLALIVLLTV